MRLLPSQINWGFITRSEILRDVSLAFCEAILLPTVGSLPGLTIQEFEFQIFTEMLAVESADCFDVGQALRPLKLARYILLRNRMSGIYMPPQFRLPVSDVDHPTIPKLDE